MPAYATVYPATLQPDVLARFWSHVRKTDGCWLWNDTPGVYGEFSDRRVRYSAHRLSYCLAHGTFDWRLEVCHTCDTPGCVRPGHLFLGTAVDNARDAVRKGLMPSGERHYQSKLTREQVLEIRALLHEGVFVGAVARQFGVSRRTVIRVRHGDSYAASHDGRTISPQEYYARGERARHAKLTAAIVREIRRRGAAGEDRGELARVYGVNRSTINKVIARRCWAHVA